MLELLAAFGTLLWSLLIIVVFLGIVIWCDRKRAKDLEKKHSYPSVKKYSREVNRLLEMDEHESAIS